MGVGGITKKEETTTVEKSVDAICHPPPIPPIQ